MEDEFHDRIDLKNNWIENETEGKEISVHESCSIYHFSKQIIESISHSYSLCIQIQSYSLLQMNNSTQMDFHSVVRYHH